MDDWVNKECLEDWWIRDAKDRYANGGPFPHIVISNFLQEKKLKDLIDALATQEFEHKESDLFSLAQTHDLASNEIPVLKEFAALLHSAPFHTWIKEITDITTNPDLIDLNGSIYQSADYLLPHDDLLDDRKIAFILYLTTLDEEEGGALALYSDQDGHPYEIIDTIQPVENSIVFFTVSNESWHEVQEVTAETNRVALGGWLR